MVLIEVDDVSGKETAMRKISYLEGEEATPQVVANIHDDLSEANQWPSLPNQSFTRDNANY